MEPVGAAAGGGLVHRPVGGFRRVPDPHEVMHVTYVTPLPEGITRSAPNGEMPVTPTSITVVTCTYASWQGCRAGPFG